MSHYIVLVEHDMASFGTCQWIGSSYHKYILSEWKKINKLDQVNKAFILGVLGGTGNGTSGARIKILRPLFNTNTSPKTPHLDTLRTVLDPRKVIFGHFIYLGHFSIEIPIEAEKKYPHGKERSWNKNKNSFETSEASGKTREHAKLDNLNFVK